MGNNTTIEASQALRVEQDRYGAACTKTAMLRIKLKDLQIEYDNIKASLEKAGDEESKAFIALRDLALTYKS